MGIPYANHIMNAVVLTAVLSCLNSGLYTASRMLFVLAARREAPAQLVSVTKRGVPAVAIPIRGPMTTVPLPPCRFPSKLARIRPPRLVARYL